MRKHGFFGLASANPLLLLAMLLIAVVLFASPVCAQSVFTDSGTVANDGLFKQITFTGTLKGTDTLYTRVFQLEDVNPVFALAKTYTKSNDSVKVKIVRQGTWISGKWTDIKSVTTDSVKTQTFAADTISTNRAAGYRYAILGVTGNGYNVGFNLLLRAKRE